MLLLSFIANAWPCASLLVTTTDQGALATSDAQQVILQANEAGTQSKYLVEYSGDADSFGWLVVVHGMVGEGDVTEADASEFEQYRELSQPRLVTTSYSSGGSGGGGVRCGCAGTDKSIGGEFSSEEELSVTITAEGFAGPFAYQVLSAETGDALDTWLSEEGFELGNAADTIDEYITEGGYSFVAVSLTPDNADTPEGGRQLPALAIQSDSTDLQFPARMALTSMAEQQRTIVYVVGEYTAEVSSGWDMAQGMYIDGGDDPMTAFEETLSILGSAETPSYLQTFSGEVANGWLTRFDTLAPRAVHTVDPYFDFTEYQYSMSTSIEVPEEDTAAANGGWLLLPFLAAGWVRRRRK